MTAYNPMKNLPADAGYKPGDVLFLCGELFGRGYANGIVDEAKKAGMTIVGSTVGRRDSDGTLRSLNAEELAEAEANLGGKIINIPLEAGFDMETGSDGFAPVDLLKSIKPDGWDSASFDWESIEVSRQKGVQRFKAHLDAVISELKKHIPKDAALLCTHAMAGGIPRARVFMPLLNRVFKGQGDKYLASGPFWDSALGQLCRISFNEVTADTFRYLLEATGSIRQTNDVRYAAYGYHGCGVLINGNYTWQSYTPYLQGEAKIRLENHAVDARNNGICATVYNCPEIQTNSSALFMGVEISLYPLLAAMEKEGNGPAAAALRAECESLLAEGVSIEKILAGANTYLASSIMSSFNDIAQWPHHSSKEQMDAMLNCSAELIACNANPKEIVCAPLSRAVFKGVGRLMFNDSWSGSEPVYWLNHDIIAKQLMVL